MSKPCSTWRVQIWVIRVCKRECYKTYVCTHIYSAVSQHTTLSLTSEPLNTMLPLAQNMLNQSHFAKLILIYISGTTYIISIIKPPPNPTPNYKGFLCVPKVHSISPIIALIGTFMSVFLTTLYVLQWQRPFPSSSLCIKSLTHVKHSNICGINYQQIITYLTNKYLQ